MELQIQKENINIKKKIGEKRKTFYIEKDYILPDSKPDIIKVLTESPTSYISKKEKMENKVKIEVGIENRISYLTDEGKNRVLIINEEFLETIDIEEVNLESDIKEKISINKIETSILNERKIHYKIEYEIEVIATKKENIELIYEINKIHNIETLSKETTIDTYIGHSESKISLKEKIEKEIPEESEIIKFKPQIGNIETKISYNKILVKADCKIKCIYQTKTGTIFLSQKEIPIMGFLELENVDEESKCNIEFALKNIKINDSTSKNEIEFEMEFNLSGDAYQKKEINMMIDLYGINYKTNYKNQIVNIEKSQKNIIEKFQIEHNTLVENINQLYDEEYKIKNIRENENGIEVEIQAKFIYSSFENETINIKETNITKELKKEYKIENIKLEIENEKTTLLPDSSISTNIEILVESLDSEKLEIIKEIEIEDEKDDDKSSMVIYFVKQGDSLWKIAKRFKSTVKEITNINEIEDENKINIGDKIYIPRAI